jgi:hypothetical protein
MMQLLVCRSQLLLLPPLLWIIVFLVLAVAAVLPKAIATTSSMLPLKRINEKLKTRSNNAFLLLFQT